MPNKKSQHGGARDGAGRKPKAPEAGCRVPITVKVLPETRDKLRREATADLSQGEIIDWAVRDWERDRAD